MERYIHKLKLGCAFGPDGIKAEHLKYALDDIFILHLSDLLSLCLTGGVVPHGFCTSTLIPILKKTNADPANPKNYRPITVSSVLSKILELHIMDEFDDHNFVNMDLFPAEGQVWQHLWHMM